MIDLISRSSTNVLLRSLIAGGYPRYDPTWKLAETVRFYRDVMGLELVRAISARGWGPETHPDVIAEYGRDTLRIVGGGASG